jgi:hypothetical protein
MSAEATKDERPKHWKWTPDERDAYVEEPCEHGGFVRTYDDGESREGYRVTCDDIYPSYGSRDSWCLPCLARAQKDSILRRAAPDLLAALEALCAIVEDRGFPYGDEVVEARWKRARAAIAKAEGRHD